MDFKILKTQYEYFIPFQKPSDHTSHIEVRDFRTGKTKSESIYDEVLIIENSKVVSRSRQDELRQQLEMALIVVNPKLTTNICADKLNNNNNKNLDSGIASDYKNSSKTLTKPKSDRDYKPEISIIEKYPTQKPETVNRSRRKSIDTRKQLLKTACINTIVKRIRNENGSSTLELMTIMKRELKTIQNIV